MKEQLELQHVVPYLPYGLKIQGNTHKDIEILKGLVNNDVFVESQTTYSYGAWSDFNGIKLILRPLSDLTKEITHNDETFVPMLEVAEHFGFNNLEKYVLDDDYIEYGWNEKGMEDIQGYAFGYCDDGSFGVFFDEVDLKSGPLYKLCDLESIQLLYKWHFDVFGLIEKGLAIDINTLK